MDNIRSQLLKVVQPSTSSLDLGGSFPRSNDVDDGSDYIVLSSENSHESDSVNSFSDDVEFVMVIDVGVNDYILVQSFEFVPTTSYASNTLLWKCHGFGSDRQSELN